MEIVFRVPTYVVERWFGPESDEPVTEVLSKLAALPLLVLEVWMSFVDEQDPVDYAK